MDSSLPFDTSLFILDWMCFLRTSLPAIDFDPHRDSSTASPDSADSTPRAHGQLTSREKAPSCSTGSRRRQHAQRSTSLSESGLDDIDALTTPIECAPWHLADSEYDGVISEALTADNAAYQQRPENLVCWEHGCNGRVFTTSSNLARHRREHSDKRPTYYCPKCGAYFSRKTARNTHVDNESCTRIRRYSNGRKRPKDH